MNTSAWIKCDRCFGDGSVSTIVPRSEYPAEFAALRHNINLRRNMRCWHCHGLGRVIGSPARFRPLN